MKGELPLNYVRPLRRRWALTQKEVADLLGFYSRSCVSRIEQGERVPDLECAMALELLFGIPAKDIFPAAYAQAEEDLMRNALALYEGANADTPRDQRKRELLLLALRRATDSANEKNI